MDMNDKQFQDLQNQNGNSSSPNQHTPNPTPDTQGTHLPPDSDDQFEGILSDTVFTEPNFTQPNRQAPTNPLPAPQAIFQEPRYGDAFIREANYYQAQGQPYPGQTIPAFQEPPIPERRRKSTMWIALGIIALLLFTSILAIQAAFRSRSGAGVPVLPPPRGVTASAPSPTELSNSFREISKAVKPAVVYIEVTERAEEPQTPEIFGFPSPGGSRRRQSAGSGFIVTNDGYIITNNHVVDKASKIEVTLADNRKDKATVIGTDRETDLA